MEQKPKDGEDPQKPLREALETVDKAMTEAEEAIWGPTKPKQGIATPKGLMHELGENAGVLTSTPEPPNGNELLGQERAAAKLAELQKVVDTFVGGPLSQFAEAVQKSGLGLVPTK